MQWKVRFDTIGAHSVWLVRTYVQHRTSHMLVEWLCTGCRPYKVLVAFHMLLQRYTHHLHTHYTGSHIKQSIWRENKLLIAETLIPAILRILYTHIRTYVHNTFKCTYVRMYTYVCTYVHIVIGEHLFVLYACT